jgi:hypothetical protein
MGNFIRNIDEQTKLLKEKLPSLRRSNVRIMNMPIRAYLKQIKGSADESIFETYMTELSSEIAKLSTGSTGSVAEVSVGAREKWEQIHDLNLPVSEVMKLVDSLKHLGKVRLKSVDDEIREIRRSIASDLRAEKKKIPKGETEGGRKIRRTGTKNGRKVIQYEDGSIEYAK